MEKKNGEHTGRGLFLHVEGEELKCCVTLKNASIENSGFKETSHCYCNPLGCSKAAGAEWRTQLCEHLFGGSNQTRAEYNEDNLNEEERITN